MLFESPLHRVSTDSSSKLVSLVLSGQISGRIVCALDNPRVVNNLGTVSEAGLKGGAGCGGLDSEEVLIAQQHRKRINSISRLTFFVGRKKDIIVILSFFLFC